MKIDFNNFQVNENGELNRQINGDILVKEIEVKDYARGKYLSMIVTDGSNDVKAVEWNYIPANFLPRKNDVCSIVGKIGMYNNERNITVSSILPGSCSITDFLVSNVDVEDCKSKIEDLVEGIKTPELNKGLCDVLNDYADSFNSVPSAVSHHHDYYAGNLKHTTEVALSTAHVCDLMIEMGYKINKDLAVTGAILHDIGKCTCYCMDGVVPSMTEVGKTHDHIVEGVLILSKYKDVFGSYYSLLDEIICSHHGKLEFGSPVLPSFLEALIVSKMDGLSAAVAGMDKEIQSQSTRWGLKKSYAFGTHLLNFEIGEK